MTTMIFDDGKRVVEVVVTEERAAEILRNQRWIIKHWSGPGDCGPAWFTREEYEQRDQD